MNWHARARLTPDRIVEMAWTTVLAIILSFAFVIIWGAAHAQETQTTMFCDTQDEITAIVESDPGSVALINKAVPHACAQLSALERIGGGRGTGNQHSPRSSS